MARTLFSFPTPFTPPTTEEDRLSWLRLIRSRRVGVSTFFRLLGEHGSAAAALDALPAIARSAGIDGYRPACLDDARAEMTAARAAGARMLCFGETAYPDDLASISDPPPLMWCIGDIALLKRPMVAMVGARNASSLGVRMARRLAAGLGAGGICVVSGLARGIDAAAHEAALDSGTVAVMAGGVDVIYPVENTALAQAVAGRGLLVSEAPMGLAPMARHFPSRNRIVSGLARAVLVVEAAARSGSLITARDALDQGREVMAVPGHPFDARAAGCNMLIRDGATLVRSVEDVLAALPPAGPQAGSGTISDAPLSEEAQPAPSGPGGAATREGKSRDVPDGPEGHSGGGDTAAGSNRAGTGADAAPNGYGAGKEAIGGRQAFASAAATAAPVARAAKPSSASPVPAAAMPAAEPTTAGRPPAGDHTGTGPARHAGAQHGRATGPALPSTLAPGRRANAAGGHALHREILGRLGPSPLAEDQLIRDLGLPAARVAIELLTLEMEGRVQRQPGGLVCLAGAALTDTS